MPTTGWYQLETQVSDSGNSGSVAWSNPTNAESQDDTDATVAYSDVTPSPISEYLKCTSVSGLNTGLWDTITQVDYRFRCKHTVTTGTPAPNVSRVSPVIGGTVQTEDPSAGESIGTSYSFLEFSCTTNIPTPAQAVASDFGVVLEVDDGGFGPRSATIGVDVAQVRFTYTAATDAWINDTTVYFWFEMICENGDYKETVQMDMAALTNAVVQRGIFECNLTERGTGFPPGGLLLLRNIGNGVAYYGTGSTEFGLLREGEIAWMRLADSSSFYVWGNTVMQYWLFGDN